MDNDAIMETWNPVRYYVRKGPVALGPSAGTFQTLLPDPPAVAAAVVGTPAVVGTNGEQIPVAFLNSEIRTYQTLQGHKQIK